MSTIYCVTPSTLQGMLSDVFVDLREVMVADDAAVKIIERVYQALTAHEGVPTYTAETIDALVEEWSDWIRARVRNGSVLQTVRDVLYDRLTDEWYLTADL
jgi:hypothetical protein